MTTEESVEERAPNLRDSLPPLRERWRASLPLTPLIDVTFLLLLYFLLTSTFQKPEKQLMTPVPSSGGKQSILLPIHISLTPAGEFNRDVRYRIDDGQLTADVSEVKGALVGRARRIDDPDVPVIIHADRDVRWAYVIEVFNAASVAGFEAVTFAPPEANE
ncbi:MAG: ExbD/TolR family protein [Candidatus Brocadiia bacterium]